MLCWSSAWPCWYLHSFWQFPILQEQMQLCFLCHHSSEATPDVHLSWFYPVNNSSSLTRTSLSFLDSTLTSCHHVLAFDKDPNPEYGFWRNSPSLSQRPAVPCAMDGVLQQSAGPFLVLSLTPAWRLNFHLLTVLAPGVWIWLKWLYIVLIQTVNENKLYYVK